MAIPFDLIFEPNKSGIFAGSGVSAWAICDGLDPVLHPSRELRVFFEVETGMSDDGSFRVESLQFQSLANYLMNQSAVRSIAEAELSEARKNWLRGRDVPEGGVWSDTTFEELWLPCGKHNQFDGGGPHTASVYILDFAVKWDDEHVRRTLKFRDDKFVNLGIEGD